MNGWAHSNMTIASGNETQAFLLNGTNGIRLGSIAINVSSTGQIIRNVAFNDSVVQVEFDREGSVQLIINSSAKPSQVFADNNTLTMAQSISGLTPASEAWVYDQNSHTLIILADPMSITLIYGTATSTPIPEFPPALELMITVGWLAIVLMIRKGLNEHYTSHSAENRMTPRSVQQAEGKVKLTERGAVVDAAIPLILGFAAYAVAAVSTFSIPQLTHARLDPFAIVFFASMAGLLVIGLGYASIVLLGGICSLSIAGLIAQAH